MAAPREELQAFQIESRRHGLYISLGLMLLLLPVVHLLADRVSRPLRHLARQAEAIDAFEVLGIGRFTLAIDHDLSGERELQGGAPHGMHQKMPVCARLEHKRDVCGADGLAVACLCEQTQDRRFDFGRLGAHGES